MNEVTLFVSLEKCDKSELINLLENSYFEMNADQRQAVFGSHIIDEINNRVIDQSGADDIVSDVNNFYKDSTAGVYYAPFNINSKNYMDIPEETSEWCNQVGIYLDEASQLTKQNFHTESVHCFKLLFDLFDKLADDDIVFADELGSWMIGGDKEQAITCYITSASTILPENKFAEHIAALLKIDSYESYSNQVYKKSLSICTKEQMIALQLEASIQKIKIKVP